MAKILYGQNNKKLDREYWGQLERDWKRQKEKKRLETVQEEKGEEKKSRRAEQKNGIKKMN